MKHILTVALLQMVSEGTDQQANLKKGETYCRQAKAMGADIVLFPEMWNIGYTFFDPEIASSRRTWAAQAISADDAFVRHFRALACELDMAIGLTYLERWEPDPRNTITLIDRHGDLVLTYAKVHTCDFGFEMALTPGDDFYVTTLDTAQGDVQIGAMICYDREFSESARVLMLKGAEIILTPNACPLERNRLMQYRTRAFENMTGMAMANYASPQQNGHSVAFDGIAFGPSINGQDGISRDMALVEADEQEGIFLARFDLDVLRTYREGEVWGNAYRKPGCYGLIASPEVYPPFVRQDARR